MLPVELHRLAMLVATGFEIADTPKLLTSNSLVRFAVLVVVGDLIYVGIELWRKSKALRIKARIPKA
jgi:hypothetical protein